jgi:type I restriction enzyme S subunit
VNRLRSALEKVILPPKELCSDFGEFIKPIEVQKYKFECQINKLKQQRDMLFPKLISGAIQIKHTYEVVA